MDLGLSFALLARPHNIRLKEVFANICLTLSMLKMCKNFFSLFFVKYEMSFVFHTK